MRRLVSAFVLSLVLVASPAVADDEKPASSAPVPKKPVPSRVDAAKQEADAKKRAILARPAPRSLSEARRRLAAIRVNVDFQEMPFTDAVAFVGRLAGFNVIVGPELQRDGLDALPTLTFKLREANLRQVADLIVRFSGTKLAFEDGILSFTTPEAARGKPVLRIYSIGELTVVLRNFPGPDMNLRPSGAEFEQEEITEVENPYADPEKIVDMLKELVAADTWEDEAVSISADSQKLIVRQYPEVQRKIARFLVLLRASR
jgi:hypothetical protein